jgi:hypothetical protein
MPHFPRTQNFFDFVSYLGARMTSVAASSQQSVVIRFDVTDVSGDGKSNRSLIKGFRRCRPAHPSAVFKTGMFGDNQFPAGRTTREYLFYPLGELIDELMVEFGSPLGVADSATLSLVIVCKTLFFGFLERFRFDQ